MGETFKVGDVVEWQSQAGGNMKTKRGKVVHVLKANEPPNHGCIRGALNFKDYSLRFDGLSRPFESYFVAVERGPKAKPYLYWPRPSKLRKVG